MKYTIRGTLHAAVCDDKIISVANTVVRFYRLVDQQLSASLASAQPKETFKILDEDEIKSKQKDLLGETKTDSNGNYTVIIDGDKKDYAGEPVEVVLYYASVPDFGQSNKKAPKNFKPFGATINVLQPKWMETNTGLVASWKYRLSKRVWCRILSLLDIWVICGTLRDCETQKPLSGIEVIAMDDDIITDDRLGSAVTDGNGQFCIYYTSKDFKKTFLSPWINIETPFFPFGNGPDVYFKYAVNGIEFEAEDPSRGRKSDREDVDNCFCVDLCLNDRDPGDEEPETRFFAIGQIRRYNSITNINPVDGRTTGKVNAGWNGLAFYSNLALVGALTEKLNGQPMEYLFQYTELSSPTDPISTAPGSWNDVVPSEIANTVIGYGWKFVGLNFEYQDIAINANSSQIPVSFNGNWIQVPQTGTLPNSFNLVLNNNGPLIKLISSKIIGDNKDMTGLVPGNSTTTVHPLQKNRYISIRMLKREAGSAVFEDGGFSRPLAVFNTRYDNVPQKGSWLPTATSNELGVASVDLAELASGGSCAKLDQTLNVNYTAANPNLGGVSISMIGPGGPHNFDPVVFTTAGEEAHGTSSYVPASAVSSLPNCAYRVVLSAELKMTNGEDQHNGVWDEVLFCKSPSEP